MIAEHPDNSVEVVVRAREAKELQKTLEEYAARLITSAAKLPADSGGNPKLNLQAMSGQSVNQLCGSLQKDGKNLWQRNLTSLHLKPLLPVQAAGVVVLLVLAVAIAEVVAIAEAVAQDVEDQITIEEEAEVAVVVVAVAMPQAIVVDTAVQ